MIVREVKETARAWVETYADELPGFRGAILAGSINWMADDAPWTSTSDVDIWGILDVDEGFNRHLYHQRFNHDGLIVDFGAFPATLFQEWQRVVASCWFACQVAAPSVLVDLTGELEILHEQVADHYAERKWVLLRCKEAMNLHEWSLEEIASPNPSMKRAVILYCTAWYLAVTLLVANLENPTTRKSFVQARRLLVKQRRLDVYESLLTILGCQDIDRVLAEDHYQDLVEAFSCSSRVAQTRFFQDHFARETARSAVIDGTKALLDDGYPREAVGWMLAVYSFCQTAIELDGSEEEAAHFGASYTGFLNTLGLHTLVDYEGRAELAANLRSTIARMAEEIMDDNDQIV